MTLFEVDALANIYNFNPTLVQLESAIILNASFLNITFQSHIGAIRIRVEKWIWNTAYLFQSHIGAIRMHSIGLLSAHIKANFNPTLVQLE